MQKQIIREQPSDCSLIFASSKSTKMNQNAIKCFKYVDDKSLLVKYGKTGSGKSKRQIFKT